MPTKTKILPAQPDPTIPTDMAPTDKKAAPQVSKGSKRQAAEEYLRSAYEFQFNEITGKPEYRPAMTNGPYIAINDFRLNTFARDLDKVGWQISTATIKEILSSDFVEMVNPIRKYFNQLPHPGNIDHIKELADTVTTSETDFYFYLKKWLVAAVACACVDPIVNESCIVFCGETQGQYKTTWLNNLVPRSLKQYYKCGEIEVDKRDTFISMTENFIINIDDQIHKLNRKDENSLKNIITTKMVKCRRPYDRYEEEHARICSFCASINGNEFLTDASGSRRFVPFNILRIDISAAQKINMDLVYSQAMNLFNEGFEYWIKSGEVEERNKQFNISSIEEQLILSMFTKEPEPDNEEFTTKLQLQPASLISIIETHTKQKLSLKKVGEAMKKHGFEKIQRRINGSTVWVYECYRVQNI